MLHIYSFDPGKVTGWCHFSVHNNEIGCFTSGETDHIGIGNLLSDNLALKAATARHELEVVFVVEPFMMNNRTTPQPFSLETIGLIRYFAASYGVELHFAPPSAHKNLIKDNVIKQAGLWIPGKGHSMDAVRVGMWYTITKRGLLKELLKCPKDQTDV